MFVGSRIVGYVFFKRESYDDEEEGGRVVVNC